MSCDLVRSSLWDFTSRAARALGLPADLASHLGECRECALFALEVNSMRSGLRNLPVHSPSPLLSTKLQVIASRERAKLLIRRNPGAWARESWSRARMWFNDLLCPLAVPATGGILTSVLCFGLIGGTVAIPRYAPFYGSADIPIQLFSQVAINDLTPFPYSGPDVTVELTISAQGEVTDYELPSQLKMTPEQMRSIGNLVLYSTFTPLVRFGQPVSSKVFFHMAHMNVRG